MTKLPFRYDPPREVNFLEKWMQAYPSSLQVTQRPYGIPREVRVRAGRQILCLGARESALRAPNEAPKTMLRAC